jgi:exodeoxyribonuclease I
VSKPSATLLWHDYETFGVAPQHDFPSQFAAIRTDHNFKPIGAAINLLCRAPIDYLPSPYACLVTGLTPQVTASGLSEPEFAAHIHFELSASNTTSVGYNSMRFDEEFTRQILWRNFYPPYAREYQHGNARFDVIDVMRMAFALRPAGLHWPSVDGKPSFKLSELSQANALEHTHAHDALSDVQALISLARKLREAQPKLWDYAFSLRRKALVQSLINYQSSEPLIHVSQRFGADRGCLALWLPICAHPSRPNEIIGIDLAGEIDSWIEGDAEELADRIFIRAIDLPEGSTRVLIKTLHLNRAPMIAELKTLQGADLRRLKLDPASEHPLDLQLKRATELRANLSLIRRLQAVYASHEATVSETPSASDGLYSGFISNADSVLCEKVLSADVAALPLITERFSDPRLKALLWRYQARHFPESLSPAQSTLWRNECLNRIQFEHPNNWARFQADLQAARAQFDSPEHIALLDSLSLYANDLLRRLQT